MAKVADPEMKDFWELHEGIRTIAKLKLVDYQTEKLQQTKQRAELITKEITAFPKNVRMYESVGRMFLLEDINTIRADLNTRIKTIDEKVKTLESEKSFLQGNLSHEDNIRELMQ